MLIVFLRKWCIHTRGATMCSMEVPCRVSEKIWLILPEIQIFKGMRVYSHEKTKIDIFGIECEIYASFGSPENPKTFHTSQ